MVAVIRVGVKVLVHVQFYSVRERSYQLCLVTIEFTEIPSEFNRVVHWFCYYFGDVAVTTVDLDSEGLEDW